MLCWHHLLVGLRLATSLSRGKTGEGKKGRETCNTWQPGSLAGQDSVQSASFYKKPISNHMLRKDNDTTERGSAMFFDNARLKSSMKQLTTTSSFFENGSMARLFMNINEHAKYYKSLSLLFHLPSLPRERLVASHGWPVLSSFFMAHENGDNKGQTRDDTCKVRSLNRSL